MPSESSMKAAETIGTSLTALYDTCDTRAVDMVATIIDAKMAGEREAVRELVERYEAYDAQVCTLVNEIQGHFEGCRTLSGDSVELLIEDTIRLLIIDRDALRTALDKVKE